MKPNSFDPCFDDFIYKNVLCIFHDKVNIKHFVRIFIYNEEDFSFYIDEIYGTSRSLVIEHIDGSSLDFTFNINECESRDYDEVYLIRNN